MRIALLIGALGMSLACADPGAESTEDLGNISDKNDDQRARDVAVSLAPGEIKRFRVSAKGFTASLEQRGKVKAKLSAKSLELSEESPIAAEPRLTVRGDGTLRNWTLRVENAGDDDLEATLHIEPTADEAGGAREIGVVSDIDKTVLPPETAAGLPDAYPGVAALYTALELRASGVPGDVYYVTARSPDRVEGLDAWMDEQGLPAGPIDTGISQIPSVSQPEKVRDIVRIFEKNPTQKFVLFGDTAHRDPEVYREILDKKPDQVSAVFIHKVNDTVNPDRVDGMNLVESYAEAAAVAFGLELLDEPTARSVMTEAKAQGLAITAAEIDALIESNRP